jgi:hypothetical protein
MLALSGCEPKQARRRPNERPRKGGEGWIPVPLPQLRGLGRSSTAEFYGIGSRAEACAYLAHPVLGPRLTLSTEAVLKVEGRSLHAIFGSPDDLKFSSSMTLFSRAQGRDGVYSGGRSTASARGGRTSGPWRLLEMAPARREVLARTPGLPLSTP